MYGSLHLLMIRTLATACSCNLAWHTFIRAHLPIYARYVNDTCMVGAVPASEGQPVRRELVASRVSSQPVSECLSVSCVVHSVQVRSRPCGTWNRENVLQKSGPPADTSLGRAYLVLNPCRFRDSTARFGRVFRRTHPFWD